MLGIFNDGSQRLVAKRDTVSQTKRQKNTVSKKKTHGFQGKKKRKHRMKEKNFVITAKKY